MNDTLAHSEAHTEHPKSDPYRHLGVFAAAIFFVGTMRFVLTVSGVEDSLTRWSSMTVVILAGLVYFARQAKAWKSRLIVAYVLIAPYMLVETVSLGYTWASGRPTIFHAEPYTGGVGLELHFWGHLVGGLTFEPWSLFVLMSLLAWLIRIMTRHTARTHTVRKG